MTRRCRVMLLCGEGKSSRWVYNAIAGRHDVVCVLRERPVARGQLIRRRIRNLGLWVTLGQLLFIVGNKFLALRSRRRLELLMTQYDISEKAIEPAVLHSVESVNGASTLSLVERYQPQVIIVNGTRIISAAVLRGIDVPVVNTHMGITPRYRGVHGGYWALATGDPQHCGVTVHLVDAGIDTGDVLYQASINPSPQDSFNSYPLHQMAAAIPLLFKVIDDVVGGRLCPRKGCGESGLWYHPTIWRYLLNWLRSGVR